MKAQEERDCILIPDFRRSSWIRSYCLQFRKGHPSRHRHLHPIQPRLLSAEARDGPPILQSTMWRRTRNVRWNILPYLKIGPYDPPKALFHRIPPHRMDRLATVRQHRIKSPPKVPMTTFRHINVHYPRPFLLRHLLTRLLDSTSPMPHRLGNTIITSRTPHRPLTRPIRIDISVAPAARHSLGRAR